MKYLFCFCLLFELVSHQVIGQVGGRRSFEFLNLPGNARISGLGGVNVSNRDADVNLFLSNPSLLQQEVHQHISLSHFLFLADITLSNLTMAYDFEKAGMFAFGLQYLNYGSFDAYDDTGLEAGQFRANEYAFTIGHSRTTGLFTMGANLKFANSNIASFQARAFLLDIGGLYKHPVEDFTVGLVIKNFGLMAREYISGAATTLPFDVQLGTTFKPEFMPFRFSITGYNFYRLGSGPSHSLNGNKEETGSVNKILNHFAFGTEVLLNKNINLRAGYNHLIRQELRLEEASGGAGFSLGFLIRIKAFEFAYSKAFYHVAGGTDYFTLTSNLGTFIKNKKEFKN
ncbi:hypothetical protein BH23BAC1_BH23BAC1_14290 [soil metagenome]